MYNWKKLDKYQKITLIFFGVLAGILLVKFVLITTFTVSVDEFLSTYPYYNSDSFDWVANGMRLFENSSISFRNPGLVLAIKALVAVSALYLLPLLNQLVLLVIVFAVYGSVRQVTGKYWLGIAAGLVVFASYSIQIGTNFLLADFPATAGISMAIYFLVRGKYPASLASLGVSMLIQNFAYFLYPLWIVVILRRVWPVKKLLSLAYLAIPAVMVLPWHLYKFAEFGDPFYTKITQFGLLRPHLDSLSYYAFNMISFFGLIVLIAPIAYLAARIFLRAPRIKPGWFLMSGTLITAVFWMILYDWEDRRFLAYLIPWVMILGALLVDHYFQKKYKKLVIVVLVVILYHTSLPITTFLSANEIPLVHNYYLKSVSKEDGREVSVKKRANYSNILMNASPMLYNAYQTSKRDRDQIVTFYRDYAQFVEDNYDSESGCINLQEGYRRYLVNSYLLIKYNTDIGKVKSRC